MRVKQTLLLVAGGLVIAGLVFLVQEVKQVPSGGPRPEPGKAETNPLTDVAARPAATAMPRLPDRPGHGERPGQGEPPEFDIDETGQAVAPPTAYVLPDDLPDPANPPQETEPLALPGEPIPPDPFTEPEIAQDPNRGGRGE